MKPKTRLIRRTAELLLILLVTLFYLYPKITDLRSQNILAQNADLTYNIAILYSNLKHLQQGDLRGLYDLPIIYPYSGVMVRGMNLLGQSLLVLPLYGLGVRNYITLYLVIVVTGFFLLACSVFFLLNLLVRNRNAALLWTLVFALMPFKSITFFHLNILYIFPSFLAIGYLIKTIENPKWRSILLLSLCLLLQILFSISMFLILITLLPVVFIGYYLITRGVRIELKVIMRLAGAVAVTAVVIYFLFLPYFAHSRGTGQEKARSLNTEQRKQRVNTYLHGSYSFFFPSGAGYRELSPRSENTAYQRLDKQLLPGFGLFFLLFLFFCQKASPWHHRLLDILFFLLILSVIFAVLFFQYLKIPTMVLDFFFLFFFLLILAQTIRHWQRLDRGGRFLLVGLLFFMMMYYNPLYRLFLPIEGNYIYLIQTVLPTYLRQRGARTYYYLNFIWLGLGALAFRELTKKTHPRKTIPLLLATLIMLENIPPFRLVDRPPVPLVNERAVYQFLTPIPRHYGIFELPARKSLLNTIYHDHHVYAGSRYGVGELDPLELEALGYGFITRLTEPGFIKTLQENGLQVIIIHKAFIRNRFSIRQNPAGEVKDKWRESLNIFNRLRDQGYLSRLRIKPNRIIALISPRRSGPEISVTLPTYALRHRTRITLQIQNPENNNALELLFNGEPVKSLSLAGTGTRSLDLPLEKLRPQSYRPNRLVLRSSRSLTYLGMDIR